MFVFFLLHWLLWQEAHQSSCPELCITLNYLLSHWLSLSSWQKVEARVKQQTSNTLSQSSTRTTHHPAARRLHTSWSWSCSEALHSLESLPSSSILFAYHSLIKSWEVLSFLHLLGNINLPEAPMIAKNSPGFTVPETLLSITLFCGSWPSGWSGLTLSSSESSTWAFFFLQHFLVQGLAEIDIFFHVNWILALFAYWMLS